MEIEFSTECPECEKEFKVKLAALKPGTIECPHCKESISFAGEDFSLVQQLIDDIERTLESFKKKSRIRFK